MNNDLPGAPGAQWRHPNHLAILLFAADVVIGCLAGIGALIAPGEGHIRAAGLIHVISFCRKTSPEGAQQESPGRKPWEQVNQDRKP